MLLLLRAQILPCNSWPAELEMTMVSVMIDSHVKVPKARHIIPQPAGDVATLPLETLSAPPAPSSVEKQATERRQQAKDDLDDDHTVNVLVR